MKTKWLLILFIGIFFFSISSTSANACEIEFEVIKGKKETYQTGDTLIVAVKVKLTHRSCPVAIKKTKFKMKGLKVIKSTKWKQLGAMEFERKLIIVVGESKDMKLNLTAIRECDKDGGFGTLKLEMTQNTYASAF